MSKVNSSGKKSIVLENPFHPLDLSARDLLTVYKKFDMSRQANRNPKQQLPIQTIAQLISSLKGCKPSYVQKCMTQALIKQTLSWNDFLAFLDQESQVRQKILDWLINEKAIIKYKFKDEYPFRQKVQRFYDQITSTNCLKMGDDELMLVIIDYKKVILILLSEGKFEQIDSFIKKNQSEKQKKKNKLQPTPNSNQSRNQSKVVDTKNIRSSQRPLVPMTSKFCQSKNRTRFGRNNNKSVIKVDYLSTEMKHVVQSDALLDDEEYYKREKRNIHSLFNLFNELPLEKSKKIAQEASEQIRNRTLNSNDVSSIKEKWSKHIIKKQPESRDFQVFEAGRLEKARKKLAELYQQKSKLTYNPYKKYRSSKVTEEKEFSVPTGKKIAFDRKEKEYFLEQSHQIYNDELKLLGIVFYNWQICLLKVVREYNKIMIEEQDSLKIVEDRDHKKNDVVESVEFYHHRITNKWFLLVLFRSQYKNESKALNESFIKGYEIGLLENKRRAEFNYFFPTKKEQFFIDLGKCSMVSLLSQPDYGIHAISNNGKYVGLKEDYPQNEVLYFRKDYEEKFKNSNVSLICLAVSGNLNKTLLGTIKGTLIIFDQLSHQYKLRKLANSPILEIKIKDDHGYIFCGNERIIVYDILRNEEIQTLNVKNEEKLHEKSKRFQIFGDNIITYGTNLRIFQQFIDESLKHEKRKMENMYTWRLKKVQKRNNQQVSMPRFSEEETNAEIQINSQSFFIVLTEIQEVIFFSKETQQIKFTIILDIPFDSKVMKMMLSPDEKLLAILLFNQVIQVFNVYTQDLFMTVKPSAFQKYTTITFLDKKNQYFMAAGSENGDIYLIPYPSVPEKPFKVLEHHKKSILMTIVKGDYLISTGQDNRIAIWQLPFNILRHQVKNNLEYICDHIGFYLDHTCFLRALNGTIAQINMHQGFIKNKFKDYQSWVTCATDQCMGLMVGVHKGGEITVLERNTDKDKWAVKKQMKLSLKGEIIGIGIVPCEKAVFFSQEEYCIWAYKNEKLGRNKSFVEGD